MEMRSAAHGFPLEARRLSSLHMNFVPLILIGAGAEMEGSCLGALSLRKETWVNYA
jgi:hypothetical protein